MSFMDDMHEATKTLERIQNFDREGFANQLKYWLKELEFFYNTIVPKQSGNPSTSFYEITPALRPRENQIAFFNLRRGYPKETYDGHYCYVLKDFGTKYVIIPTTSVKDESKSNPKFEYDIKIKDFKNDLISRLQVTDLRAVDAQRFNGKRTVYDVVTDKNTIVKEVQRILSFNIDTIEKKA